MLLDMSLWWNAMSLLEKIYWCIAIPFSLLFIIQMVMTFIGGDMDGVEADGDADAAIDSDTGIDFQFLTIKNLIAFFTIMGWVGIIGINSNWNIAATVIVSFFSGSIMMLIMATLMYYMGKLTESGTLNLKNAIGKTGTVYLAIPGKRAGMGKVQIKVQGYQTLDAITDGEDIPTGAVVQVVDVISEEILLVKTGSL